MAHIEVAGEIVSPGIKMAREAEEAFDPPLGNIPGLELDSARVFFDVDSAIAAGHLSIEEITGGVRVDAETGELSHVDDEKPFIDPESPLGRGVAVLEVEAEETVKWIASKGMGALRRKLNRRHQIKSRKIKEAREIKSTNVEAPTMPRRVTKKEREQADRILRWHSRAYKSNSQARYAW